MLDTCLIRVMLDFELLGILECSLHARNGENIQTTLFILSTQRIVMILPATVFAVQPRSTYFSVVVQPRKRKNRRKRKKQMVVLLYAEPGKASELAMILVSLGSVKSSSRTN